MRMKILTLLLLSGILCKSFLVAQEENTVSIQVEKNASQETIVRQPTKTDWTVIAYIQADNNLAPFAEYNISDMQQAPLPDSVNMLVQWDQPHNNKTWRYRVVHGGRIEDLSLSTEMGINPVEELVDMMNWAKSSYDAKQWCVILWNHGSGVIDPRSRLVTKALDYSGLQIPTRPSTPWLQIPGFNTRASDPSSKDRGILFDDSQFTYATNKDLSLAFGRIKSDVLGKNIDIVGMDACFMAMLEVGYQIKNSVDFMVASEQTEPGEGWSYSGFLDPLSYAPYRYDAEDLARLIVFSYGQFYRKQTGDYTQSAMQLNKLEAIKDNLVQMIEAIDKCNKVNASRTRNAVQRARHSSISFDLDDYIDLYSFYNALRNQFRRNIELEDESDVRAEETLLEEGYDIYQKYIRPRPRPKTKTISSYTKARKELRSVLYRGKKLIKNAVVANSVGHYFKTAKGISIYYPTGRIHSSYPETRFAQDTGWVEFIRKYQ